VIERLVNFAARHSRSVLACALALALLCEWSRTKLASDPIPDLSDPQVVVLATWMGHPAPEVSERVTSVLSRSFAGVPGSTRVRGTSMSGMAYIDVAFEDGADLARGRRLLLARVEAARASLPRTARIEVGPEASSTGWMLEYVLVDATRGHSPAELRRLQEQVLRPALAAVPGVAEVATVGAGVREVAINADEDKLRENGLTFSDVLAAVRARFAAPGVTLADIERLRVAPGDGRSLAELARVRVGRDMPAAIADLDGASPAVGGIVIVQRDVSIPRVAAEVRNALAAASSRLPPKVDVVTVYDRSDLAGRVQATLARALLEEIAVVVLVVLLFLWHGPSAVVPLLTLPCIVLLTFGAMWLLRVPASVMSLGGIGIALGMAVDAEIVALEACHRALAATDTPRAEPRDRRARLIAAANAVAPAVLTALIIAALGFVPVFAFGGESGRLLRPLALSKTIVIGMAALVAVTLAPALRDILVRGGVRPEFEHPLTSRLVRLYRPVVHFSLARPRLTLATALLALASGVPVFMHLGAEFLPRIDEGDLLFMPSTLPGVPPMEAGDELRRQDAAIKRFPEVETVFGKVGRAETATDPAPYSMVETTVRLKPRASWPSVERRRWYTDLAPAWLRRVLGWIWPERAPRTTSALVDGLDQATHLPGWINAWTSPVRARMDMMATGVRTPLGLRIVARDPERLERLGEELRLLAERWPNTRSAATEGLGGEVWPRFELDAAALARHEVDPDVARATAALVLEGGQVGEINLEGEPLRVRLGPTRDFGVPAEQLRGVTVRGGPRGAAKSVPLALLGHLKFVSLPAQLRSEEGEGVAYVYLGLEDRADIGHFVADAKRELARAERSGELRLRPGERIEWTGQYALLEAGERRLEVILPLVMLAMLGLLFAQFRSLVEALIVFASVPLALVGSVWTLFLLEYPLSAPVWVGLLSVIGLATQTAVVMVVYIDDAFYRRLRAGNLRTRADIVLAHAEGTVLRLRPKLMTVATMAASLLPLLWSEDAGSEILKKIAAPMLGGLITSAFLTLEVLPVLYTLWRERQLRQAEKQGIALETLLADPRTRRARLNER
jgi:Cu(I)/Ag(I) efflux system membrane protein CusA/SilA